MESIAGNCRNLGNSQQLIWIALTRIEHDRKISTFRSGEKVEIERREINSTSDISVGSDVH